MGSGLTPFPTASGGPLTLSFTTCRDIVPVGGGVFTPQQSTVCSILSVCACALRTMTDACTDHAAACSRMPPAGALQWFELKDSAAATADDEEGAAGAADADQQ